MIEINIVNTGSQDLPTYATEQSAGLDLKANIEEPITLNVMQRALIKTGLHMELPKECVAFVCPRSGLALKQGVTVLNAPGVIDADFRGDIGVILINLSDRDFTINPGDKIAQLVVTSYEKINFHLVNDLGHTERGDQGFGHSGI